MPFVFNPYAPYPERYQRIRYTLKKYIPRLRKVLARGRVARAKRNFAAFRAERKFEREAIALADELEKKYISERNRAKFRAAYEHRLPPSVYGYGEYWPGGAWNLQFDRWLESERRPGEIYLERKKKYKTLHSYFK
jgi:hypothetical protein